MESNLNNLSLFSGVMWFTQNSNIFVLTEKIVQLVRTLTLLPAGLDSVGSRTTSSAPKHADFAIRRYVQIRDTMLT